MNTEFTEACSICGIEITFFGDKELFTKEENGSPYICDECMDKIQETEEYMYTPEFGEEDYYFD